MERDRDTDRQIYRLTDRQARQRYKKTPNKKNGRGKEEIGETEVERRKETERYKRGTYR